MTNFLDALKMINNAGIVENYAVLMLIVYLTDVWGLGITHAAGLINTWVGIARIMQLIFLFLMDNYIGSYWLLVISTTASALGMGLLSISTPSWLYSLITGSCNEYKMKCISETQQSFFYFALVLLMIGRSTRDATMESLNFKGNAIAQELMKESVTSDSNSVVMQASILFLTPWSIIFGISSICSSMAVYLLMGRSWSHKLYINKPEKSMVTVFQEVKDAKTIVKMLPVGLMLIFLVLISSIGSTYFLQQAKRMKPVAIFGVELINVSYLVWLYFTAKVRFLEEGRHVTRFNDKYKNKDMLNSVVVEATIYATVCCVIAALVEKSRLSAIRKHGLANKPDEIIPMTMLWLLPQFLMLGCFDSSVDQIIQIYFAEEMPLSMKKFMMFVFEGFLGVGVMSSVLVVYVVGKISEIGGKPNWFQHDTENSRFDLFYWTLSVLCVLVFTLWFHVPRYFNRRRYHNYRQRPLFTNNRRINV